MSSPPHDSGPGTESGATATTTAKHVVENDDTALISSGQVSWWSVHEHVAATLAQTPRWPTVGTPPWCGLHDDDPRKQAALCDAAQHWALRLETCQEAQADARKVVSAAADWKAIGTEWLGLQTFYAAHPWMTRVVAS